MMLRRRRAGLAIVAICLSSLATLVAAGPDLEDCALRCVTISATATCNIDNYECVCQGPQEAIRRCITTICPGTAGTSAKTQFELQCENVGFPLPNGATHTDTTTRPPANTSTPSNPTTPPADTTDPPPPTSGTRTSTDPADTAGTATHSSTDAPPTGSSGPKSSDSNPSGATITDPVNGATNGGKGDSNGGGSSIGSLIGAIIGGLVGGLLVVALVWFILRRRRRQLLEDDDGVVAYGVPRGDNMSYLNESKGDPGQPILMGQLTSSHKYSASGSGISPTASPFSSPAPAGFIARGPESTADSDGTYAARPFIANETGQQYNPRKGDPPRAPVYITTSSIAAESVAGSSSLSGGGAGRPDASSPIRGADDSASVALSSPSAQELTPEQLNLVQTMVNRGLPGAAVVDVIQRMLVDNQAVPPEYRPDAGGTMPPPLTPGLGPPPPITPGLPPPPLTPAPPGSTTSGSSTGRFYRQSRS